MAADSSLHGAANLGALLVRAFRWFEEGLVSDPDTAHLPRLSGTQFMALASLDGDGTSIAPTYVRLAWHCAGTFSKEEFALACAEGGLVESIVGQVEDFCEVDSVNVILQQL